MKTDPMLPANARGGGRSQRWRWALGAITAGYWITLLTATHLPARASEGLPLIERDKLLHFLAYCGLGGLIVLAACSFGWRSRSLVVRLWLGLAGLAMLDEVSQFLVPGRQPSLGDWLADAAGLAAGMAVGMLAARSWWGTGGPPVLQAGEAG